MCSRRLDSTQSDVLLGLVMQSLHVRAMQFQRLRAVAPMKQCQPSRAAFIRGNPAENETHRRQALGGAGKSPPYLLVVRPVNGRAGNRASTMLVVARVSSVITVMIAMPVGEDDAATQGEQGQNGDQPGDTTQHLKNPQR